MRRSVATTSPCAPVHDKCSSKRSLAFADLDRQLAGIALGLARLALQPLELAAELADHREAREIGLGSLEPQFGLVAAPVQAGDAGCVLQDAAALLGLGVDDLGDLALATSAGERAPVAASSNRSLTSRGRASLPLTR